MNSQVTPYAVLVFFDRIIGLMTKCLISARMGNIGRRDGVE
jgi:hypothetical protein